MSDQPIYDETVANAQPQQAPKVEDSPPQVVPLEDNHDAVESDSKGFIPVPGNEDEGRVQSQDNHDATDVDAALGRETEDGPGFGDESQLPDEDFESFAESDVEVNEQ